MLFSLEDNLQLLTTAYHQKREKTDAKEGVHSLLGVEQLIKAVTSNEVLELVTSKLLES